jgi:hypothetical protein
MLPNAETSDLLFWSFCPTRARYDADHLSRKRGARPDQLRRQPKAVHSGAKHAKGEHNTGKERGDKEESRTRNRGSFESSLTIRSAPKKGSDGVQTIDR